MPRHRYGGPEDIGRARQVHEPCPLAPALCSEPATNRTPSADRSIHLGFPYPWIFGAYRQSHSTAPVGAYFLTSQRLPGPGADPSFPATATPPPGRECAANAKSSAPPSCFLDQRMLPELLSLVTAQSHPCPLP